MTQIISRSAWGAQYGRGSDMPSNPYGVTIHWNGPGMGNYSHKGCKSRVKNIERYHVQGNGWSGIGYNLIVCRHGYIFEGRGRDHVGAHAGASNIGGNSKWYGVQAMVGTGDTITPELKRGLVEAVKLCRSWGAGPRVNGHRDHHATDCPGGKIYSWVRKGMPMAEAPPEKPSPPPQKEEHMDYTSIAFSGQPPLEVPPNEWVDVMWDTVYQDGTGSHGDKPQQTIIQDYVDYVLHAGVRLGAEDGADISGVQVKLRTAEYVYKKAEGDQPARDEFAEAPGLAHATTIGNDGEAASSFVGRVNKEHKLRLQVCHDYEGPLFVTYAQAAAMSEDV